MSSSRSVEAAQGRGRGLRRVVGRAVAARLVVAACVAGVAAVAGANAWVAVASQGRVDVLGSAGDTHRAPVALVLGAGVRPDGTPSPSLSYRLDAAARLYGEGRVGALLVSGARAGDGGDEVAVMRERLVALGVPEGALVVDGLGVDTRASCERAARVYGVREALVVSQDFHLGRAVALCRHAGVEARGVADTRARANGPRWAWGWVRERLAAVKAAAETLLGAPVPVGEGDGDGAVALERAQAAGH